MECAGPSVREIEQELLRSEEVSPEDASCCLSRVLYCWAFPTFWRGFRRGRTDLSDLPPVPQRDCPTKVVQDIQNLVMFGVHSAQDRPWLRRKIFRVTRANFIQAFICKALMSVCTWLQPIILHNLLQKLSLPEDERKKNLTAILMNALGLAFTVMAQWIFAEYSWTVFVRADLQAQVLLQHLVYRKSLFLRLDDSPYTVGDLQNHYSTDCTKLQLSFFHFSHCQIVLAVVTLVIVAWHLTTLIGSAGIVGMLTILLFAPLQFFLQRRLKVAAQWIQEARDVRGRLCNQFLSAMRVVKCFSLELMATEMLHEARNWELQAQWYKRKVFPAMNFLGSTVSLFGTIASFVWLELVLDRPVDAAIAFTADDTTWLRRDGREEHPDEMHGDADFLLQDCDVGWPIEDSEKPSCRGVQKLSLEVKPKELLLISGPIGAGKSTLLEAFTGTRPQLSGICRKRGGSMAYVAQRPWLLNGTFLENLLFGLPEDPQKLQDTLESCALLQDLDSLPSGLQTLVGEEGVQLSGGQKQRLALARAVYSGARVVLMDDVLSALDAHVGRHVFEKVICGQLRGKTRLLVTHQVQYWSHPAVTRILLLRADGTCGFLGTYQQLQSSIAPNAGPGEVAEIAAEGEENGDLKPQPSTARLGGNRFLDAQEQRRVGRIQWEDLVAYARACGGAGGVFSIASLILVYYGAQLASSLQLAIWSNANIRAEESGHPEARDASRRYLVMYVALCLLTGVSCFSFFFGIQLVALRGSRRLHDSFMEGLLYTQLRFFDLTPTGRALNRCLKDMATIDDRMPAAFRELFESFMNVCISVLIISLFATPALMVVPPFVLVYWLTMKVYRWAARDLKRLEGTSRSPGMSHFADSIKGARTIRAFGHEARFLERNLQLLSQNQLTTYWFWVAQAWISCTQEVLGTFALAVVAGIIGYRAYLGLLNPGLAGLALTYCISMPRTVMFLSRRVATMEVEFVSIERVMEYTRLPREAPQTAPPHGDGHAEETPHSAAVLAEGLYLRYEDDGPLIFNGLSLSIPSGSSCALVGRTGCGKSSFLSALVRLYPLCGGKLYLHGQLVTSLPLPKLRSMVRVLLQDPIFFTGTIRSNLLSRAPSAAAMANEDEVLWQQLRQVGLEPRIRSLPLGLDAQVEENGQNFSQGERQLLCLARVLVDPALSHPSAHGVAKRVLLCDEPTAACDLQTDQQIHQTLLHDLDQEWTLVVVCHRLQYIREFQEVFVFDAGQVVEQGSPQQLLKQAGNLTKMCQQQGVL